MKKVVLFFALAVGLLTSASTLQAQVNMSRYITLTVAKDSAIKLDFKAAAAGTPVRIVSGSTDTTITVDTNWTGTPTYTADGTTMTVYGDITGFDCEGNRANLTALDPSHNTLLEMLNCINNKLSDLDISKNTKLKILYCNGNDFTTATLDRIYCTLPDRTGNTNGVIQPVFNSSDPNHATVLATNKTNAINKNWKVQYYEDDTDITTTTGTYVCSGGGEPNMDSYITLTVANGAAIKLDFKAAAAGTPVRIVSGTNTQDITVGTNWKGIATYTAGSTTMTVYGDIIMFYCSQNGVNLTVLDPSHNTQLTELSCRDNKLTDLDVSGCTQLTKLWCYNNTLTSLDVSGCTQLTELHCYNNNLNSLDVSGCTQLTTLWCYNNTLNSLNVSGCTQLEKLYCHGNNLTTSALDNIYCALPDRTSKTNGVIQPVYSDTSSNHATVLATNKQNAIAKNWKVQYYNNNSDIPATSGTYVCPQLNMSRYITLTVKKDSAIKLDFKAAAAATPIRIVSGSNTQDITVGTTWYDGNTPSSFTVTAGSTTMTIYGDIIGFDCYNNGENITCLDPSHNTQLTELWCRDNKLTDLDVSQNTQLTVLWCYDNTLNSLNVSNNTQLRELGCSSNTLNSLDVSGCTQLTKLYCNNNNLSNLDVSQNTQLTSLYCFNNTLNSLDVSGCTKLTGLYCYGNTLSSLDVSQNTQLKNLSCHGNDFTTSALDDIFCALPDRTGKENGKIQPVLNSSDPNHATVLATNAQNAITKNWKVQYYYDDTDIPATTGTYTCPQPNTSRYITLTVTDGAAIKLDFKAAAAGTPVRIVSGSNTQDITVGTDWVGTASYTADSTTMTIYGDIIMFDCSNNGVNLTALDPSHNTELKKLYCYNNQLSSLDVSNNTLLESIICYDNQLSSLDVSHNTQLTVLGCYNNKLNSLDVSGCTQLDGLYCYGNTLSSLDVSGCTQLRYLYCYGNNFSTQALDDIYCALPNRTGESDRGEIFLLNESSSAAEADTVKATTAKNATDKNWKVRKRKANGNHEDIATTGNYDCSTSVAEATAEQALTLYPNPVADVLYLSATARTIRVYNVYGIEVAHATDTDRVEVSHLPAGVYTVKADGTVAKMVKR